MSKTDIYINLSKKGLKETEKKASDTAKECSGDEGKDELMYNELKFECENNYPYFDESDNKIEIAGDIKQGDKKLGYLTVSCPLNFDLVVEIIEAYRKKLKDVRKVLEATSK